MQGHAYAICVIKDIIHLHRGLSEDSFVVRLIQGDTYLFIINILHLNLPFSTHIYHLHSFSFLYQIIFHVLYHIIFINISAVLHQHSKQ